MSTQPTKRSLSKKTSKSKSTPKPTLLPTHQPSISAFFSSPNANSSNTLRAQKRALSIDPTPSKSKRTQNQPIDLCSSSPDPTHTTFVIPSLPKFRKISGQSGPDRPVSEHEELPEEGEEFVRPPELADGQDDNDWDALSDSGSSVTMRVEEEAEDGFTESLPAGAPLSCPICATVLDRVSLMDAERHVNGCLDQLGPALSAPERNPSPSCSSLKLSAKAKSKPSNAYCALMAAKAEQQVWASSDEPPGSRMPAKRTRGTADRPKSVPFYKIVEGTTIAVDAFKYGKIPRVTAYFLSHAHADHYTNLGPSWAHGLVYCSRTTANLIQHNLGVKKEWVRPLEDDVPCLVDGVRVTLIDANHCPGSSLFVFEGISQPGGKPFTHLHCGDFRASPVHLRHPALKDKPIDICYLDTTYLNPKYCFPAQEQVIKACAELVKSRVVGADRGPLMGRGEGGKTEKELAGSRAMLKGWLSGSSSATEPPGAADSVLLEKTPSKPKVARIFGLAKGTAPTKESILVLIGTYTIGKERIVKEIAKTIGSKIYCDNRKARIFKCIEDDELHGLMTDDPYGAQVHVTNLFAIKRESLEQYLGRFRGHFTHIIGLRPTGWAYKPQTTQTNAHPTVHQVLEMFKHPSSASASSMSGFNQTCLYPQRDSTETCQAFGVPYSEHSSFYELTCFCVSMDWKRIIPTVNCGNPSSRAKMKIWIDRWKVERNKRVAVAAAYDGKTIEGGRKEVFVEPRHERYW